MEQTYEELHKFTREISLGKPLDLDVLTVFPILKRDSEAQIELEYITLEEAKEKRLVKMTEIGSGSVPEVMIKNRARIPLFLLEGEEIVGALQNRVFNLSFLIPARDVKKVPVSCVERGRWKYRGGRNSFGLFDYGTFSSARRAKVQSVVTNLRKRGEAKSDQGHLWSLIAEKARLMDARSSTEAMDAIYQRHINDVQDALRRFVPLPKQVGIIVGIGGRIAGLDCFDQARTWHKLWRRVLSGYIIEAIGARRQAAHLSHTLSRRQTESFMEIIISACAERRSAIGLGEHLLFDGSKIGGFALCWKDQVIHIYTFM